MGGVVGCTGVLGSAGAEGSLGGVDDGGAGSVEDGGAGSGVDEGVAGDSLVGVGSTLDVGVSGSCASAPVVAVPNARTTAVVRAPTLSRARLIDLSDNESPRILWMASPALVANAGDLRIQLSHSFAVADHAGVGSALDLSRARLTDFSDKGIPQDPRTTSSNYPLWTAGATSESAVTPCGAALVASTAPHGRYFAAGLRRIAAPASTSRPPKRVSPSTLTPVFASALVFFIFLA